MKKKVISVLKQQENVYIFCLFLLFFPLKTQLQNGIMFLFDVVFRNGITTENFTYNYKGIFIGCDKIALFRKTSLNFNWFQKDGIYWIQFIPSLLAFLLLYRGTKKNTSILLLDWIWIVISCFSILTSLNNIQSIIINFHSYSSSQIIRTLPITVFFLLIGIYILIRIFTFKERIQAITFGLLGFYCSFFLWMKYLGPIILPII
ncbi:hypothetical protein [Polaribacter sp. KT 15]|uniref:hypothetical protein n=1 Tax=Polaribacter sp. KT 15 TaxID=1896175 RepID=UPI0009A791C6|nr:hypothetical protein [Polaribacter sp. KT 15]